MFEKQYEHKRLHSNIPTCLISSYPAKHASGWKKGCGSPSPRKDVPYACITLNACSPKHLVSEPGFSPILFFFFCFQDTTIPLTAAAVVSEYHKFALWISTGPSMLWYLQRCSVRIKYGLEDVVVYVERFSTVSLLGSGVGQSGLYRITTITYAGLSIRALCQLVLNTVRPKRNGGVSKLWMSMLSPC